jgi:hypothetical protein
LLEHMAQSKFNLKKIQADQIIHLSGTTLTAAELSPAPKKEL